jgi:hypothetical protein
MCNQNVSFVEPTDYRRCDRCLRREVAASWSINMLPTVGRYVSTAINGKPYPRNGFICKDCMFVLKGQGFFIKLYAVSELRD